MATLINKFYKFVLFLLLILFCGLIQVPIAILIFLLEKTPFTLLDLIRDGILITYSISLFSASCYTTCNRESRPSMRFRVFTVGCTIVMLFAAIIYAHALSESVIKGEPVFFAEQLIPCQLCCATVAVVYCFVVEFGIRTVPSRTRINFI
jgi:hypothetical protein